MSSKKLFRSTLLRIAEDTNSTDKEITQAFNLAVRAYGSETNDNIAMLKDVDIGPVFSFYPKVKKRGLKLKDTDRSIADILNVAEDSDPPPELSDISKHQWQSSLRLATLVFCAFENRVNNQ